MATATLRPDGLVSAGAHWTTNAASHQAGTSDNSDATRSRESNLFSNPNEQLILTLADSGIAASAVITSLTMRARLANPPANSNRSSGGVQWRVGVGSIQTQIGFDLTFVSTPTNFAGTAKTVDPSGAAWTVANIDNLQAVVAGSGDDNVVVIDVYELFVDVVYNTPPTVSAVTVPAVGREDITVSWTYTDPEADAQTNRQIKIFTSAVVNGGGFDANSSTNVFDSGTQAGASTSYAADSNLGDGRYYAYVRATDAGTGNWSAWAASSEFRIVDDPVMMI